MNSKLSSDMSISQFDNGYWYADELKEFAQKLGISSATKLRKDELEDAIKHFLKTGNKSNLPRRALIKSGIRDIDIGLRLDLPILHYTSNKITKVFLAEEAKILSPGLKQKSGTRYRLNRWREEQITAGNKITYGDLVGQYVVLNQSNAPFEKIPSGRYINFLSEFSKNEEDASQIAAIEAWAELKEMDIPKTYAAWKKQTD